MLHPQAQPVLLLLVAGCTGCPCSPRRITIPEIRQHPWFVQALPQPYSQARTDLLAEQATIDAQVGAWGARAKGQRLQLMRGLA